MNRLFRISFVLLSLLLVAASAQAQMWNGRDTLYGNEWINYARPYFKFLAHKDGVYRLEQRVLDSAFRAGGQTFANVKGSEIQVWHKGKQVPVFVTTDDVFSTFDFVELFAKKNDGELDSYLYRANEQTNPRYSLFTDTAAYFLTWIPGSTSNPRINDQPNDLSVQRTAEPYYLHQDEKIFTTFANGKQLSGSYSSSFDPGEGYGSRLTAAQTVAFPTAGRVATGPAAQLSCRVISGDYAHLLKLEWNTGGANTTLQTDNFNFWRARNYSFNLPASQLGTGNFNLKITGLGGTLDVHGISTARLIFPKSPDFGNVQETYFWLENQRFQPRYYEISNYQHQGQQVFLYDLTNLTRTEVLIDGSLAKVVVQAPTNLQDSLRQLYIANENVVVKVGNIKPITFRNPLSAQGDYIIVTHKSLTRDAATGANPVQDYANYRRTTGFTPTIWDIEELEDQFAYGTKFHNVSIRNFSGFVVKNWVRPQYMFIIGKGRAYVISRVPTAPSDQLIPAFGLPECDVLHVTPPNSLIPRMAIGRLAAKTTQDVTEYLEKVRELEASAGLPQTITDRVWMKNVLHLGGGDPGFESSAIRGFLDDMGAIIRAPRYGARVHGFFKTSTDPIQLSQSLLLDSLVNNGVSLITFFGHSSPNSFDFNLDRPENYNNRGRHPLIVSLGCYSGNIFGAGRTIGEDFVMIPQKGAIGFMASSYLADVFDLNLYGSQFYRHLSGAHYGKGIGRIMQEVNRSYGSNAMGSGLQLPLEQIVLHGDPAVRLNSQQGPDYTADNTSYSVSPALITTALDTITVELDVTNIGSAVDTAFWVSIERIWPDGSITQAGPSIRMRAPYYRGSLRLRVPVGGIRALGINRLRVFLDSQTEVAEFPNPAAEQNNRIDIEVFVSSDELLPISPDDFGIVGNATDTRLRASVGSVRQGQNVYYMEIDTTELFNSPLIRRTQLIQSAGVVEWQPPVTWADSTVYYWRVAKAPAAGQAIDWRGRSFIYLSGPSGGWNQSHFYQFKKDAFTNINLPNSRRFEFADNLTTISLENAYVGVIPDSRWNIFQNGNRIAQLFGFCGTRQGIFVSVFDSLTQEPWINPTQSGRFGSLGCNRSASAAFFFPTDSASLLSRLNLVSFLNDTIPDGAYVLVTSMNDYGSQHWQADLNNFGTTIFQSLEDQGAVRIRQSTNGRAPYAFFYRKGRRAFQGREVLGDSTRAIITPSFLMPGKWNEGNILSTTIGPARSWQNLQWRSFTADGSPQTDSFFVDVFGVNTAGLPTLLYPNLRVGDSTLFGVSAQQYPYLQLRYSAFDNDLRTPRQLKHWRTRFQGLPEAALRPETFLSFRSDTIYTGQSVKLDVLVQNISSLGMDSILVKLELAGHPDKTIYRRYKPLPAQDTLYLRFEVDVTNLSGPQSLLLDVNPNNDQPELYHFNNVAVFPFFIQGDKINPLLDVTFDGQHIMNGDLISARPEIQVVLRDENRFLALDDTMSFQLYLRNPQGQTSRIYFAEPWVRFFPANGSALQQENKASIQLRPTFLQDGQYEFLVRARDKAGNESGSTSYRVLFRIVNKQAISQVFNYPNPFTTQTQFVFTLTGDKLPSQMVIQIMTPTGRVVREITQAELGPLRVGLNRTSYAWDGTDEFGDRLANGVYLYRVMAKDAQGKDLDLYDTGQGKYFNEGWGKMYLMR